MPHCEKIACALKMPEQKINSLRLFARFHDIGKVGISDAILFKPGKLTVDESGNGESISGA